MNMMPVKLGIAGAVIFASLATPVLVRHDVKVGLREKDVALRQQTDRLAEFTAENRRLSDLVAQAKPAFSDEQFRELMRLRGKVGMLRRQTNATQLLREENRRLEARLNTAQNQPTTMSPGDFEQGLLAEKREAMRNICLQLPQALQRFASDHTNQAPTDLLQLRNYFSTSVGEPMLGLRLFQLVSDRPEIVVPANALLLRDPEEHRKPDGKWARLYAYGDGRIIEAMSDDGNFDDWEKQHTHTPSASQ
jgi:hypothetical protein